MNHSEYELKKIEDELDDPLYPESHHKNLSSVNLSKIINFNDGDIKKFSKKIFNILLKLRKYLEKNDIEKCDLFISRINSLTSNSTQFKSAALIAVGRILVSVITIFIQFFIK